MTNSTSFNIFTKSQEIYIKPDNIKTRFDGLRSFLEVIVSYTFRKPNEYDIFDVMSVNAKLKLQTPSILLSELTILSHITVDSVEYTSSDKFSFVLDDKALFAIEKYRSGDANFSIEFSLGLTLKTELKISGHLVKSIRNQTIERASLSLNIPKSIWVEELLSNIGHKNLKLVEIPLNHKLLKEAYDDIIFEFNKAEKYFNDSDFDKCVAHCRSTLDALTRNLIKIKKEIPSETAFKWLENIGKSTYTWIDELNKSSQTLGSKPHHAGHKDEYTRQEAESIYLVTLGLLNFVGHIDKS
ncbi:MAG: hypothetical protein H0U95_13265 [Bacteroidetes bacterium]|nr:hypothetical protein [Bacteroidota bacterium]